MHRVGGGGVLKTGSKSTERVSCFFLQYKMMRRRRTG